MSRGTRTLRSRWRLAWLAIILVGALSLGAHAQDEAPTEPAPIVSSRSSRPAPRSSAPDTLLPRKVIVSLPVAQQLFPELTGEEKTGENASAIGKPKATRMVVYITKDGAKKIILSVDEYASLADASYAYQQAARKSELPEFNPIALSNVGEKVFAGIITQGADTHVEVSVLEGTLMVGATLAGFPASTENIGQLAELTRQEVDEAKLGVGGRRKR